MLSPARGKAREKRAGTPGNAQIGCRWVWGTGERILVLPGALVLAGMHPAGARQHITALDHYIIARIY